MKKSLLVTLLLAILAGLAYFGYQYLQVSDIKIEQPEVVTIEPQPFEPTTKGPKPSIVDEYGRILSHPDNAIYNTEKN